jgi:hypothetical protein
MKAPKGQLELLKLCLVKRCKVTSTFLGALYVVQVQPQIDECNLYSEVE